MKKYHLTHPLIVSILKIKVVKLGALLTQSGHESIQNLLMKMLLKEDRLRLSGQESILSLQVKLAARLVVLPPTVVITPAVPSPHRIAISAGAMPSPKPAC